MVKKSLRRRTKKKRLFSRKMLRAGSTPTLSVSRVASDDDVRTSGMEEVSDNYSDATNNLKNSFSDGIESQTESPIVTSDNISKPFTKEQDLPYSETNKVESLPFTEPEFTKNYSFEKDSITEPLTLTGQEQVSEPLKDSVLRPITEQDQVPLRDSVASSLRDPLTESLTESEPVSYPLTSEPLTSYPLTSEPLTSEPLTSEPLTSEPLTEPLSEQENGYGTSVVNKRSEEQPNEDNEDMKPISETESGAFSKTRTFSNFENSTPAVEEEEKKRNIFRLPSFFKPKSSKSVTKKSKPDISLQKDNATEEKIAKYINNNNRLCKFSNTNSALTYVRYLFFCKSVVTNGISQLGNSWANLIGKSGNHDTLIDELYEQVFKELEDICNKDNYYVFNLDIDFKYQINTKNISAFVTGAIYQ